MRCVLVFCVLRLQESLSSVRADLEASMRQLQQEHHSQAELQHRLQEAETALAQVSGRGSGSDADHL
jgi:septal ring factor EnvC (AmiA/AmiB activator)